MDDGHRHLAYVAVNTLGLVHALAHRAKPVDALTRRPLAPRLMTANLILERSQCLPLQRQDEDMAFELLMAEPLFGIDSIQELIRTNPALVEHFPQLADKPAALVIERPAHRLPSALFPRALDGAARALGERMAVHAVDPAPPSRRAGASEVRAFDHASLRAVRPLIAAAALGIVSLTSVLLLAFGLNLLYLTWRATRLRPRVERAIAHGDEPLVCVQVPIYNERYVAERVLDAVCELDWPPERLEVQVLDDSDDETVSIIARRAAMWRLKGFESLTSGAARAAASRLARSLTA